MLSKWHQVGIVFPLYLISLLTLAVKLPKPADTSEVDESELQLPQTLIRIPVQQQGKPRA